MVSIVAAIIEYFRVVCMMKKLLAVAVILLFISVSVIPSTGTVVEKKPTMSTLDGKTLYVGGSGPGNYTRIQDAIDNASDGDTVFVYDDSSPYNEFVWINKSINLIGEDRNTTVIDGWGTGYRVVVYITADNVVVTGLRIYNCSELLEKGILISSSAEASNIVIRGNIIENNWHGIVEGPSSNNSILNNIIINTTFGILSGFASTTIKGNTILNHTFGIAMQDTSNIVEGNYIYTQQTNWTPDPPKNTWGISDKIHYFPSCMSIIKGNTIINHLQGISCSNTLNHIISGNTLIDNYIGISLSNSSNNEIIRNNITNSYWYGLRLVDKSNNNMVIRNTIANNSEYGIYLQYSFYNKFKENNIMKSNRSVYFGSSLLNRWMSNYWERPRLLPYPIFGKMKLGNITFPWLNFDWRPALKPHDILGGI